MKGGLPMYWLLDIKNSMSSIAREKKNIPHPLTQKIISTWFCSHRRTNLCSLFPHFHALFSSSRFCLCLFSFQFSISFCIQANLIGFGFNPPSRYVLVSGFRDLSFYSYVPWLLRWIEHYILCMQQRWSCTLYFSNWLNFGSFAHRNKNNKYN
jgi:hypothetical protein